MVLDVIRALGRRWYIVLAGLVLTCGMVFGAYKLSPPEYSASALVLLLPPKADFGKGGNPFLGLSGLEQPASIVATYLSSAPARDDVKAVSATADYEIALDASTRGPVLAVHVTDKSAGGALTTVDYLLKRVPKELARLQDEVGARGRIAVGSMELTVDQRAEVDTKGTTRIVIAAAVAGLVGTGFAAFAFDGWAQRRRRAQGGRRQAPDGRRQARGLTSRQDPSDGHGGSQPVQTRGSAPTRSATDAEGEAAAAIPRTPARARQRT